MSEAALIDQGIVVKIENDLVHVEIAPHDACGTCGARVLCKPGGGNSKNILIARNMDGAQVGDLVSVYQMNSLFLKISLLQWGLPLLGFLTGLFGAFFLKLNIPGVPSEITQTALGLAGLLLMGLAARQFIARLSLKGQDYLTASKV